MLRPRFFSLPAIGFGLFALSLNCWSQQSAITESKRQVIAELIAVMKLDTQIEKITDTMLKGMQDSYSMMFNAAVDQRKDLTEAEKTKIKAAGVKSYVEFSEKFRKRLPEFVDYRKYVEDDVYPIYDKFFSEAELRDLITFYETATGQKVLTIMPELFAESQAVANEKLVPQIIPLVEAITKEQIEKAAPPKPRRKVN